MKRLLASVVAGALLAVAAWGEDKDPCKGSTTPEIEACLTQKIEPLTATMNRQLTEIRRLFADEREDMAALDAAQKAWRDYVEVDCKAVYEHWSNGTIRGAQFLGCKLAHTKQRNCDLWSTYLEHEVTDLRSPPCP